MIHHVTDPRTGIARTLKFMPSVAEIVEACERAKRILPGLRQMAEREALGFRFVDDRANNKLGYFNSEGVRWEDREKPRALPSPPADPEKARALVELIRIPATVSKPEHEPRDDGKHGARVAAELAAKKARRTSHDQNEQ